MSNNFNDPLSALGAEEDVEEIPLDDDPPPVEASKIEDPLSLASDPSPPLVDPPQAPLQQPSSPIPPPPSSNNGNMTRASPTSTSVRPPLVEDMGNITLHSNNNGNNNHQEQQQPSSSSNQPVLMHISVSDPVRRQSDHAYIPGLTTSHFEYLITTLSPPPSPTTAPADEAKYEVRRRFNDFVALADLLEESYRGYFIFPRPDKNVIEATASGKTTSEFVELRRFELERYLKRLADHPVVGKSEALKVFLQAEGALSSCFQWQQLQPFKTGLLEGVARLPRQLIGSDGSIPTTTEATKNAKHTNDWFRRIKEFKESMKQEYQGQPFNLPPEELRLKEAKAGVEIYAEQLAHASRKAEKLVSALQGLTSAEGDLGLSLMRLGKYEDEKGTASGTYTDIGTAARLIATNTNKMGMTGVQNCRNLKNATSSTIKTLEPIYDELAMAPAVVSALKEREAAKLTVLSLFEDLDKKKLLLTQYEGITSGTSGGGTTSTSRKMMQLKDEVAALSSALEAAQREYDRVKERNEEELKRWKAEREQEFKKLGRSLSQVQAGYYAEAERLWGGVADELKESIGAGRGSSSSS